ncbi:ABC transporter ATP-binding protein [uncultured Traorella sp.]|uniref:ABC transporter ATP-binding protein n=1 Tax=uncultured Traorella sp. TaxID=1929048 RepID=UPI0025CFF334|nr:ABC transporter ATP-binding protein [uncultured Traorella sp.]
MKKYSIWDNYKYLYKYLWKYSPRFVVENILEVITNAIQPFLGVLFPSMIIGLLEGGSNIQSLVWICLLSFSLAGILNGLATYFKNRNWFYYIFVRCELFWPLLINKSMDMDYALYESEAVQNDMNKAMSAINNNSFGIEGFFHQNVLLLTSISGLILYSLVISHVHPLIVVFLLTLSLIQYLFYFIAKRYENAHQDEQAKRARYQRYFFDQSSEVKNGKDIRLYQLSHWLTSIFERYNREYQHQQAKIQSLYYLYDFIGLILQLIRDGVCYGYLIYLLVQGMNISEFVLYLGIVSGFGSWFSQISESAAVISRCLMQINYYREYIDLKNIYLHNSGKIFDKKDGQTFEIEFDDVCFSYPNSDRMILDHVSFKIDAAEKIALVGVNGAGKTTLVKMLCGFYKPTSGRILINGIDMNELDIDQYFDQVAVLFQDSILLSYTIAQNVTGQMDEQIDHDRLINVLKKSGLYEKVFSLPKKENTYIGKDVEKQGIQLSGGQIQKLFLARALYKNTRLLILDEPTAALDAIAESEMYDQYASLVKNKTSLFISHRLSSTRFCDRIFFLENGKIAECGTHDELMAKNGLYANMFHVQSQYYKEVNEDEA